MKSMLITCSLLALPIGTALATESPWNGTWKIDPARSQLAGDTFTYSKGPGNLLHFSDGVVAFDFAADGKEYKAAYDRTTVWTAAGPNAWDTVSKANGKVLRKTHQALSPDGKTLTIHQEGTRADGSTFDGEDVYMRQGAGEGLIGTWKSIKAGTSSVPQIFIISVPAPGKVHVEVPDMKGAVDGKADGSDLPVTGDGNLPAGMTVSYKFLTPSKLKYVIKVNGKEDEEGVQTLAADGKSFTDVSWSPGKEDEKQTCFMVKQ
jgi:hypothetical protein